MMLLTSNKISWGKSNNWMSEILPIQVTKNVDVENLITRWWQRKTSIFLMTLAKSLHIQVLYSCFVFNNSAKVTFVIWYHFTSEVNCSWTVQTQALTWMPEIIVERLHIWSHAEVDTKILSSWSNRKWPWLATEIFSTKIQSSVLLKIKLIPSHCSKSSFFVQKFNFDFPRKLSTFWG